MRNCVVNSKCKYSTCGVDAVAGILAGRRKEETSSDEIASEVLPRRCGGDDRPSRTGKLLVSSIVICQGSLWLLYHWHIPFKNSSFNDNQLNHP